MQPFGDAIILCGGKSERMTYDKALITIEGRYLIDIIAEKLSYSFNNIRLSADKKERFAHMGCEAIAGGEANHTPFSADRRERFAHMGREAIVGGEANYTPLNAGKKDRFSRFGLEVIEDGIAGNIGPAAGICASLAHATTSYLFVIAGDMPYPNIAHIERMKQVLLERELQDEILVPLNGEFLEPLYAFYRYDLATRFAAAISEGQLGVNRIIRSCNTYYFPESESRAFDKELAMFTNINYLEDLERLR